MSKRKTKTCELFHQKFIRTQIAKVSEERDEKVKQMTAPPTFTQDKPVIQLDARFNAF